MRCQPTLHLFAARDPVLNLYQCLDARFECGYLLRYCIRRRGLFARLPVRVGYADFFGIRASRASAGVGCRAPPTRRGSARVRWCRAASTPPAPRAAVARAVRAERRSSAHVRCEPARAGMPARSSQHHAAAYRAVPAPRETPVPTTESASRVRRLQSYIYRPHPVRWSVPAAIVHDLHAALSAALSPCSS